MSSENVEAVRQAIGATEVDVLQPGVREALVQRLDAQVTFDEDPRFPEARRYEGREEVLGYFTQFTGEFEHFVFTVEDLLDVSEDAVLICLHMQGRGKGSGAAFDFRPAWLARVREGRVVALKAYFERAEAFEAVGLPAHVADAAKDAP